MAAGRSTREMDQDYNLDELDVALSSAHHQAAAVGGPPRGSGSFTHSYTNPGTRRGSLMPSDAPQARPTPAVRRQHRLHELNLFHFDLRELVKEVLLTSGPSKVSYHEYASFAPPRSDPGGDPRSPSIMSEGEDGLEKFRQALKEGYGLDNEVRITHSWSARAMVRPYAFPANMCTILGQLYSQPQRTELTSG